MIRFVFSPTWFQGIDSVFEASSIAITFLISYYCFKFYRINKQKNYRWFGLSFLAVGLSFLAKIMTNITIYKKEYQAKLINGSFFLVQNVKEYISFAEAGFVFYVMLMLFGLMTIYLITHRVRKKETIFLLGALTAMAGLASIVFYPVFYLTSAMLAFFITKFYFQRWKEKDCKRLYLWNFLAFALITSANLVFLFLIMNPYVYVVAETLQLLGYCLFLGNIIGMVR